MTEQEMWDKFVEIYRKMWLLHAQVSSGHSGTIDEENPALALYKSISAENRWELFDDSVLLHRCTVAEVRN